MIKDYKVGDRSRCKQCNGPIYYSGIHWTHDGPRPRHIAIPIEPVTNDNGWISVDERLPEPGQLVICHMKWWFLDSLPLIDSSGRSTRYIVRELVNKNGIQWANEGVIEWTPLTPPPEAT